MAIPIPQRPSGFTLGAPSAPVTLDVFFDIQCPHSRAFWPSLSALLEQYGEHSIKVTLHLITISNHHQAWTMSLALMAVAKDDPKRFYQFATYLFNQQDRFTNAEFRHKTLEDQRQLAADLAHEFADLPREQLLTLLDDSEVYVNARTPIRYAATRSVWATPTVFINNADDLPVGFRSSIEEWQAVIDPLVSS